MLKLQFKSRHSPSIWLVGESISLGADAGCDVVLEGLGVEPLHARILISGDQLNLLSEYGGSCYINDDLAAGEQPLSAGDLLRIGGERLQVVAPGDETLAPIESPADEAADEGAAVNAWSLTAMHPKLKDMPLLIDTEAVLGRAKDVELSIPYKHLSRQHARFYLQDDKLMLEDLGSVNGTRVDGERVSRCQLLGGEVLSFSRLKFVVNAPAADDEYMNKTMMRPAIDLNSLGLGEVEGGEPAIGADRLDESEQLARLQSSKPVWLIASLALLVVAVAAVVILQF